jgi:hypothetical protein
MVQKSGCVSMSRSLVHRRTRHAATVTAAIAIQMPTTAMPIVTGIIVGFFGASGDRTPGTTCTAAHSQKVQWALRRCGALSEGACMRTHLPRGNEPRILV